MKGERHNMIVTMLNEKGGVGKSTLADELYSSFERTGVPVALMNVDAQYGDAQRGDPDAADVVIVDTPGVLPDNLAEMVQASDVVIVPTRPTVRNVEPTCRVISLVHEADPDAEIVVAMVGTTTRGVAGLRFAQWLRDWVSESGFGGHAHLCGIPSSEAVAAAEMQGISIVDVVRKSPGRYAREIGPSVMALVNYVRKLGGYDAEEL